MLSDLSIILGVLSLSGKSCMALNHRVTSVTSVTNGSMSLLLCCVRELPVDFWSHAGRRQWRHDEILCFCPRAVCPHFHQWFWILTDFFKSFAKLLVNKPHMSNMWWQTEVKQLKQSENFLRKPWLYKIPSEFIPAVVNIFHYWLKWWGAKDDTQAHRDVCELQLWQAMWLLFSGWASRDTSCKSSSSGPHLLN